jgi:hypothetical protein
LIGRLTSHLLFLQSSQENFTAPFVIEDAAPLPFALVVYHELGRVEVQNQKSTTDADRDRLPVRRDDEWRVENVDLASGIQIRNLRTDQQPRLNTDHPQRKSCSLLALAYLGTATDILKPNIQDRY